MTRIACIGEAMIELSLQGKNAAMGVAGDTLNTAIYLKRAAPEVTVDYITRLGDDPFSQTIADFIAEQDIGIAGIARDVGKSPGLYAITTTDDGERSFTYWRDTSAARGMFGDLDFSSLDAYDALYLSGITLAILPAQVRGALMTYLTATSARVIYDSNYRPRLWEDQETAQTVTKKMWALCDVALPSIDDEMLIFNEEAQQVEARFAAMTVGGALKRGPEGPMSIGSDVTQTYPQAEKVVDTTAAGDSFNGAYIAAMLGGEKQSNALLSGHLCAKHVVQHKGAIVPVQEHA